VNIAEPASREVVAVRATGTAMLYAPDGMGAMRRFVPKVCIGALASIAVAAALVTSPAAANVTATASRAFGGNPCNLVTSVLAVHITAPCLRAGTVTQQIHTPVGSVRAVTYKARWGGGDHSLTLVVHNLRGSPAVLTAARTYFRGSILENGLLFSGKPLASEFLDTIACVNPPTEDCTTGKIEEIVGNYFVQIFLHDTAPFIYADNPTNPAVGEANDRAQEETLKGPWVTIGASVAAKL
jgi:hypothetical protein